MSNNYYFQFDTNQNVLYPYLQQSAPQSSTTIIVLGPYPADSASSTVIMAYNYPSRYTVQNYQLVEIPYLSLSATSDTNQYVITATLNNPTTTPPTSIIFTILGQSITQTITNNIATLTLNMHPSVANSQFTVVTTATGCANTSVTLGTSTSTYIQVYKDTSGNWNITPTKKATLQNYYTSEISLAYAIADITTITGMLMHFMFNKIVPALTVSSTPLLTLDSNESNAYKDIITNILPYIPVTLENAAPPPASGQQQTYDIHYESMRTDWSTVEKIFQNYSADLNNIPNLS